MLKRRTSLILTVGILAVLSGGSIFTLGILDVAGGGETYRSYNVEESRNVETALEMGRVSSSNVDTLCGSDTVCIEDAIRYIALDKGPEKAVDWLDASTDSTTRQTCHAAHHIIGRTAAGDTGYAALDYWTDTCQYGYLHGALQALSLQEEPRVFADNLSAYCVALGDLDYASECAHGVGHGVAIAVPDDIYTAAVTCTDAYDQLERLDLGGVCVDGVLMEYAEDYARQQLWITQPTGNGLGGEDEDSETTTTADEFLTLCGRLPDAVLFGCWGRMSEFTGALYDGDPVQIEDACATAGNSELVQVCLFGAGAISVENATRNYALPFPPESVEDSRAWVDGIIAECQRWTDTSLCVESSIGPSFSHLYTAGIGYLVDDACQHLYGDVKDACEAGVGLARRYKLEIDGSGVG